MPLDEGKKFEKGGRTPVAFPSITERTIEDCRSQIRQHAGPVINDNLELILIKIKEFVRDNPEKRSEVFPMLVFSDESFEEVRNVLSSNYPLCSMLQTLAISEMDLEKNP